MPRNVKESDDEFETKGGRRTRTTIGPSVLDSPLRRSSRIKQPVAQNESSPESVSDVSAVGGTRNTRRRTTALDITVPETTRNLRTRRNSAASDISELAENDSTSESTAKRFTRRSIATLPSVETPTKMLAKARRSTRAGSETKSTPPVGRVTRRTRASSMEPEATEEIKNQETETPLKSKRRASALPSEPAVAEESEEIRVEKTVFEIDEEESELTHNVSKSPRRKSKGDTSEFIEKMEVDEAPVEESEVDTIENTSMPSVAKALEDSPEVPDSSEKNENSTRRRSISSPVKGSSYTIDNLLNKSAEVQEVALASDENETSNGSARTSSKSVAQEVRSSPRISEKRGSLSLEDERSGHQETKISTKIQQIVSESSIADKILAKRDYSLESECVVVIEPMNVEITTRKFDSPANQAEKQQHKFDIVADKATKNNEEDKENEETRNEMNPRITSVTSVVQKDSEDDKGEEKKGDRATEFSVSSENTDVRESPKKIMNDEQSSTNRWSEENSFRESSMEKENVEKSDNSEITTKEPASPRSNVLDPSTNAQTPGKSDENEKTSREIPEASIVDEIPSKSEDEILSRTIASPSVKIINRETPVEDEMANNSGENDGKINCETVKDRKSSIVTESPSGEANAEESMRLRVVDVTEESLENGGIASETSERARNEEAPGGEKNDENDEFRVTESENESEIVDCPSFKDIPAEEWTDGRDINDEATRGKTDEDSLHSFSTERNESECDIALVDKEPWQPSEIDREADKNRKNLNYDSDETVIARIEITAHEEGRVIGEEATNEETSQDFSSDVVHEDNRKKSDVSSTRRRSSLNSSIKSLKKDDINSDGLNVSRRKSSSNVNEESNKSSNDLRDNLSRKSINSSGKKRNANSSLRELKNFADEMEIDVEEDENTSKSGQALRTSLDASVKRSSTASVSLDTRKSEERKSLNESRLRSPKTAAELRASDEENATDEENRENADDERESRDPEGKISESGRRSTNGRNSSKMGEENSNSEMEDCSRKLNVSSSRSKSRRSINSRNASKIEPASSSSSEIEDNEHLMEKLNISAKSKTSRRSLNSGKNEYLKEQRSSSSELEDDEDSRERLDESSKSKNKRKSLNSRDTSRIDREKSNSDSEDVESSAEKLDRSKKSSRKSLGSGNDSRTRDSGSEDEAALNESAKSKKNRRSINSRNNSKIEEKNSDSEIELIDLRSNRVRSKRSMSAKKSPSARNDSRMKRDEEGRMNSGFNVSEESDSSDIEDEIPRFLYDVDSSGESDDSDKSVNSDIANEMNLAGEEIVEYSDDDVPGDDCMVTESESYDSEDDDGEDLKDFVLSDDQYESSEDGDSDVAEDDESSKNRSKTGEKRRKRIIARAASDSDSAGSSEEAAEESLPTKLAEGSPKSGVPSRQDGRMNESKEKSLIILSPEKSKIGATPKSVKKQNSSATLMELEKSFDRSEKIPMRKVEGTLLDSSTPNIAASENVVPEQTNSSKSKKKLDRSATELESSMSESIASLKEATPKTPKLSRKSNSRTSFGNSRDSTIVTISPDVDAEKVSIHHQSMTGPITDSPETRFLMKEKLNDTLPALKLQQRTKRLRRSVLDNLREESAKENEEEVAEENAEAMEEESTPEAINGIEGDKSEKKKKKKKKKKKSAEETIDLEENESFPLVDDSQELVGDDTTIKSKKRKRNKKKSETTEIEEPSVIVTEEIPTKKKKKKGKNKETAVESEEELVPVRAISDGKKKKKLPAVEPEATLSKRKSAVSPKNIDFSGKESESASLVASRRLEKLGKEEKSKVRDKSTKVERSKNVKTSLSINSEKISSSVKRLPDDLLEALAEVSERPKKRRKIVKENEILPSKRMFSPGGKSSEKIQVYDDFISLSSSGGTTRFGVVDLEKATKKSKKSVAAKSFRDRMLARNPRQPISAYLMYQQKQKASGKNQLH